MIGRRWSGIWRRPGRCGGGWRESLLGRGRCCGYPHFSSNLLFSRCCSSGIRQGWLPPVWDGFYRGSRTRWSGYWRGESCGNEETVSWSNPRRRQCERRRGLRQWRRTHGEGRIRSCSTLLRNFYWTSAMQQRGRREHGWGYSGRNMREFIWQGQGKRRRQRRRRTMMVWKSKWGGLNGRPPELGQW